jgi:hypothetical protein
MRTIMDNAVHVKVKIVELGYLVLLDQQTNKRIALGHEAEELGNPHDVDLP